MNAPIDTADFHSSLPLRSLFARNVRLWRHQRAMSQTDLAAAAGLSRPFLSSVERGQSGVSLETLEMLAAALRVHPTMLIGPLSLAGRQVSLRQIRESKGLTQSQLARHSGISRYSINRIENGKSSAGFKTKSALAHALGVTASMLA